jgi:uncharacterized protein YndB with AHSA1/START domain
LTDPIRPDLLVLRLERTFDPPAQAVFDAWTSREVLRRWWPAGSDWETPVAEVLGRNVRIAADKGERFDRVRER